jgi:hypothetical protein
MEPEPQESQEIVDLTGGSSVLCIPATSAPSERLFSTAGLTVSKKRARLNGGNAAALIFLHENLDILKNLP